MAQGVLDAGGSPEFLGFAFGVCDGGEATTMWSLRDGRAPLGMSPLSDRT
jgi:hypothetical protein